jgi:hypothetical protein
VDICNKYHFTNKTFTKYLKDFIYVDLEWKHKKTFILKNLHILLIKEVLILKKRNENLEIKEKNLLKFLIAYLWKTL